MALVTIQGRNVGRNGQNLPQDVAAIAAALVAVGPERGGLFAPPLSEEGLAQAIEGFQTFHRLPVRDGRVDKGGRTLRRINEILNGGVTPPPPVPPASTGVIRPLENSSGLATEVDKNTWSPVESSLTTELVFKWTGVAGKGKISYFQLDDNVVPKWFGVLVPDGLTSFERAHIFFHPTPRQAGYLDPDYQGLGNWTGIFHYLSDPMAAQFCAAGNRVFIMPLMTEGSSGSCGMFPARWESILGRIFGMIKSGDTSPTAPTVSVSDVIVSSFSSGIAYSHAFRSAARLGSRLAGVIDFDGVISSAGKYSAAIVTPPGRIVRMQQMAAAERTLPLLARNNTFPLGKERWGGPYENLFSKDPRAALKQIHGTIPQTMMFLAARRLG